MARRGGGALHALRWSAGLAVVCITGFSSAPPARARVVWGDVHAHSAFSADARGDARAFYERARDELHLDFVVLSDHDIWISRGEWQDLTELAKSFNDPGRFVAFLGAEWTQAYHMNVYFRGDEGDICGGEDTGPPCMTSASFVDYYGPVIRAGYAGAHVNHPRKYVPWHEVDTDVTPNAEMYNHFWDRNAELKGQDDEHEFSNIVWALRAGLRLGFVGASDFHGQWPVFTPGAGLTGCHVDNLTRDEILDALRARRCYATDGERMGLEFDVDGVAMGGELSAPIGQAVTATIVVNGTAVLTAIDFLRNGTVVATKTDCSAADCVFSAPVTVQDEHTFIFARVEQPGGKRAWASPIWVRGACVHPEDCPRERYVNDGRNAANECLLRWRVEHASARSGRIVACTDGDPTCDADDSVGASCTFRVSLCAGATADEPNCAEEQVDTIALLRPNSARSRVNRADSRNQRTLLAALRALGPTPESGRCTPYVDVWVPRVFSLPTLTFRDGSRLLVAEARNGARRDRDAVRLRCLPPVP